MKLFSILNILKYTLMITLLFKPPHLIADKKEVIENDKFIKSSDNSGVTCYNRSLKNAIIGENIEYNQILEHRKKIIANSAKNKITNPIPKISHHIWLTDAQSPQEINSKDLEFIKKTLLLTPIENGWKHIFWTNNKQVIPHTLEQLSQYNIVIKEINSKNIQNFKEIEGIYLESFEYNFAMPSDIISYVILEEFGGIYFDVDYELKKLLDDMLGKYSFLAHEEPSDTFYIGNALIGAVPHHPVIKEAIKLVKRNFSIYAPDYVSYACHDRAFTISGVGPAMFSIAFYNKANSQQFLNDTFFTDNVDMYSGLPFIEHYSIGIHHGSNTWKKSDEEEMYNYCQQCIKFE